MAGQNARPRAAVDMLAQLVVSGGLLAILITTAGESAGLLATGWYFGRRLDLSEPSNLAA